MFEFDEVSVADIREQYATSRDTMLSQVCRALVEALGEKQGTPKLTLEMLEAADDKFGDWQRKQRERRANPQEDGDDKAQVISVDAIARKVNADVDKTGVRALRRDGGVILVQDAVWQATKPAGTDDNGDAS